MGTFKKIIYVLFPLSLLEKTLYSLFLSPNLDKIWNFWSSNEVLGRDKWMKKGGQEAVEEDLPQLN